MERLHRSKKNRVLFGVCGGLSEYLRIDVTLIRIIWILITFFMGSGLILYLVAALVMPVDNGYSTDDWNGGTSDEYGSSGSGTGTDGYSGFGDEFYNDAESWKRPAQYYSEKTRYVLGAILIGIGVLILGKQFMPSLFDLKIMVPLLMIVIGGIIVSGRRK